MATDAGKITIRYQNKGAKVEVGHGKVGADAGKIRVCHQQVVILLVVLISSGDFTICFYGSE